MEYIYILSKKRGQGDPEVVSICDSYDKAIIAYHECDNWNTFIYKYPINIILDEYEKIQKSSKYRIKFEDGELHQEYLRCKRNEKIETIIDRKVPVVDASMRVRIK
jgi:hypothetical protein